MVLRYIESSKLPTRWGDFDIHGFEDPFKGKEHIAISMGDSRLDIPLLMRIHSECLTGDALGSLRCDCGEQLHIAMRRIAEIGRGAILYLRQEGRGIGLVNKIKAYQLQDLGADTVEANERLGFGADMRDYSVCLPMLQHLGVRQVELMTNNPRKMEALLALGIDVVKRVPLSTDSNPHNSSYLSTKAGKLGHILDDHDQI
ncbi:MAG: GTP cyclohydrolase II [Cellvibrionales bacterium TMED49]|nr:GTP cyclohydrolase II [Porticoccaceae bacterium]OUU37953.1 MAG: GTP cyclohydrolase II [Cellvibrionales bacterium TMED49]